MKPAESRTSTEKVKLEYCTSIHYSIIIMTTYVCNGWNSYSARLLPNLGVEVQVLVSPLYMYLSVLQLDSPYSPSIRLPYIPSIRLPYIPSIRLPYIPSIRLPRTVLQLDSRTVLQLDSRTFLQLDSSYSPSIRLPIYNYWKHNLIGFPKAAVTRHVTERYLQLHVGDSAVTIENYTLFPSPHMLLYHYK